ncbi:hypothetical protein DO97_11975 [Neosynechococcus sphagnicola sy1]|uniref:Glycine zipper domain-containing protein n=1 Tax=Neosynechococcus sphagnicola sy1 TaxID=1497020 RepID=A0A098TJ90_9CYAN|nr:glycine zipper domain-containing protein [Neosynechococcus sphagnicola]KGF72144.1 hypothetical protein DO97_11975 [Neosynechococcus sphagnicola sy1]
MPDVLPQVGYEIVHSTLGRMRCRIRYLTLDESYAQQLEQQLRSQVWVSQMRINAAAASLIVEYSGSQLSPAEAEARLVAVMAQFSIVTKISPPGAPEPVAPPSIPEILPPAHSESQAFQGHLESIAGGIVGLATGEIVGGAIGGVAGGMVLGPAGVLLGNRVGGFAGSVVGATIMGDVAPNLLRGGNVATVPGVNPVRLETALQKRAGDKVGATIGEVTGKTIGTVALGPVGAVIGTVIGGAVGGRIGEDAVHQFKHPSPSPSHPSSGNVLQDLQSWIDRTSRDFAGETSTAVLGSTLGGLFLGTSGRDTGRRIGSYVGRRLNWRDPSPPPILEATTSPASPAPESTAIASPPTMMSEGTQSLPPATEPSLGDHG